MTLHQVTTTWSPWHRISIRTRERARKLWSVMGFNHDTATVLRYEMDMILLRLRCFASLAYRRQARRLKAAKCLKVHLGCGNVLFAGWVNVDCYPPPAQPKSTGIRSDSQTEILTVDMRRGLPFSDGSVSAVFSEHFLEHMPFELVRGKILPEIRRILQPGGRIRVAVPNGEYFVEQYLRMKTQTADPLFCANLTGETGMIMLSNIVRGGGHYFLYDFETMFLCLSAAGFVDIRQQTSQSTCYDVFQGKDRDDSWRAAMSLYVDAAVPE